MAILRVSVMRLVVAAMAVAAGVLFFSGAGEARVLLTLDDFGAVGDGIANDTQVRCSSSVQFFFYFGRRELWHDGALCLFVSRPSWTPGTPPAPRRSRPSSPCRRGRRTRSGRCGSPGPARRSSSSWYVRACPVSRRAPAAAAAFVCSIR